MRILIGSTNDRIRAQLKESLEQLGNPTFVISSIIPLKNLMLAGYQIDMIFSDYHLADCRATKAVAEVGMTTPSILFGVQGQILKRLLKNRCFPNTTFLADSIESDKAWPAITSLIEAHKQNLARKNVDA